MKPQRPYHILDTNERISDGKDYDTVVVVSPSHREYFDAISIYDGKSYKTPLGEIEIDFDHPSQLGQA